MFNDDVKLGAKEFLDACTTAKHHLHVTQNDVENNILSLHLLVFSRIVKYILRIGRLKCIQ